MAIELDFFTHRTIRILPTRAVLSTISLALAGKYSNFNKPIDTLSLVSSGFANA